MPNEYEDEESVETEEVVETESRREETLEQREARLTRQLEQTRRKLGKDVEKPSQKQESSEPDYARLAYLASQRVEHPDDQRLVIEEANRLKLPLTDVLNMEHMKARLTTQQNQRTAENGSPSGTGRKGGAGKGDVDYYLANPDEVPTDLKLHNEVIDARIKRETENSMFSQVPFIG